MRNEVEKYLDKYGNDYALAAQHIQNSGNVKLIAYVLHIGVASIAAGKRQQKRRELKPMVKPPQRTTQRPGGVRHSVVFSPGHEIKLKRAAAELFMWPIGGAKLGAFTRELVLAEAVKERKSGHGHIKNAIFYERLAAPMNDTDTVLQHWKSPEAASLIRDEIWREAKGKRVTFVAGEEHLGL
jgi:hypothetical protein